MKKRVQNAKLPFGVGETLKTGVVVEHGGPNRNLQSLVSRRRDANLAKSEKSEK